jgi:ABC-2 type transport system ATP-binding protein
VDPITIDNLGKIYRKGLRQQKVVALHDLSLSVRAAEIFGFLGPNGAGKSTTIKILCDLIRPSSGHAMILGRAVTEPEARRHMGYLPENPNYYIFLTGWELLRFHGAIHGVREPSIRARGTELLDILELTDAAHRPIRTYSKGMVQRVGIAAAVIHDPTVLILDEPMSGLDPIGRKLVMELMAHLRTQGKTIFFSTHILHDVEIICDRIGIITGGELKFSGTLAEVRTESFSSYDVVLRRSVLDQVEALQRLGFSPAVHEDKVQVEVGKTDLQAFLVTCSQYGLELFTIEPKRMGLEDFFMSFVQKKNVGLNE